MSLFGRQPTATRQAPFAVPDLHSLTRSDARAIVAVMVYTGVTTTEVDEPARRLANKLDATVRYVGNALGTVVGVEPVRSVHVDGTFDDLVPADVVVVPGGLGWQRLANDVQAMLWLTSTVNQAKGVLTVSTGSLLLASSGGLQGQRATGHWLARSTLAELGAQVSTSRTTHAHEHRVVTASGTTAALEACDALADRVRWGPP